MQFTHLKNTWITRISMASSRQPFSSFLDTHTQTHWWQATFTHHTRCRPKQVNWSTAIGTTHTRRRSFAFLGFCFVRIFSNVKRADNSTTFSFITTKMELLCVCVLFCFVCSSGDFLVWPDLQSVNSSATQQQQNKHNYNKETKTTSTSTNITLTHTTTEQVSTKQN